VEHRDAAAVHGARVPDRTRARRPAHAPRGAGAQGCEPGGGRLTCAWITHADCRLHEMGEGHPECPERLDAISDHLLSIGLMGLLVPYDAPEATPEQLGRAHAALYVQEI